MSTSGDVEGQSAEFAPKQVGDTHSYKGWLNSDSFLKRAFAVFGYNMVVCLLLYIPIIIIAIILGAASAFTLGTSGADMLQQGDAQNYEGNPYEEELVPSEEVAPTSGAKLDMRVVCENALVYMTFENGAAADEFVEECVAGNRPEVIERYREDRGIPDDVAL